MINLLPPEEKSRIFTEMKIKAALIHWFLVIFFIFCLAVFLAFINLYIKIQLDAQKELAALPDELSSKAEALGLEKKIALLDSDLEGINKFYGSKIYFSEIINKISAVLPGNIYLSDLDIGKKNEGTEVSLSGFSPNRETLLDLKKNFDKEGGYFKNVYFPQSDWVKPSNINFFVSFNLGDKDNNE